MKHSITCLTAFLYSADSHNGDLHQSFVTMSGVAYFILKAHIGTCNSRCWQWKNSEEVLEELKENGQERQNLKRKKALAVDDACMAIFWHFQGYIWRTFELWVLNKWLFDFCARSTPLREWIWNKLFKIRNAHVHWCREISAAVNWGKLNSLDRWIQPPIMVHSTVNTVPHRDHIGSLCERNCGRQGQDFIAQPSICHWLDAISEMNACISAMWAPIGCYKWNVCMYFSYVGLAEFEICTF